MTFDELIKSLQDLKIKEQLKGDEKMKFDYSDFANNDDNNCDEIICAYTDKKTIYLSNK